MNNQKYPRKYGYWDDLDNPYVKMIPYLEYFLGNYSESSKKPIYLQLVPFALYCKDRLNKNILEVKSPEILSYFKEIIDKKKISRDTKRRYRIFINAYYEYVKIFKKDMEDAPNFVNPVPSIKIWDFTNTISTDDLDLDIGLPKMEDIEKILSHIYYTKPNRTFIILSLVVYNGARISEICKVELNRVNINERWLRPIVKSKANDKRRGIYFIPRYFVPELQHYINLLKIEYGDPIYLFQSYNNKPVNTKTIQDHILNTKKALGLKIRTNSHIYRDFINTRRHEKGCSLASRKFLLNQKVKDVNMNSYLKAYKNKVYLRDIYDKYSPFEKLIKPRLSL